MNSVLRIVLAPLRLIVKGLVLILDRYFAPKPLVRAPEQQKRVDHETASMTLYHFQACPFCVKVRRQIRRLGLNVQLKDILREKQFEKELLEGGGELQVPCLRIQKPDGAVEWMYESGDINAYLGSRFAAPSSVA